MQNAAPAAAFPLEQGRQNTAVCVHPTGDIRNRNAGLGRLRFAAGHRDDARLRLDQEIVGLLVAVRTVCAVAADVADDQVGVVGPQARAGESEPLHRAGRKILDEDIRLPQQLH